MYSGTRSIQRRGEGIEMASSRDVNNGTPTHTTWQPQPRSSHAAIVVREKCKLFIWAGLGNAARVPTATIENFNFFSEVWEEPQQLHGSLPDALWSMAVTSDGESAYSFGGIMSSTYVNTIYKINPTTLCCAELLPASQSHMPEKTRGSGMVHFNKKLVIHGGWNGQDNTDELHVFNLKNNVWSSQPTTGEKPPPLSHHTFTKIDHHRAVSFGGLTSTCRLKDAYVLDVETWNWSKLKVTGAQPPARHYHASCCIAGPLTGQMHPILMVIGGYCGGAAGDVWLLDVDRGVWSEVTLPTAITPRYGHSGVVFECGPTFRVVALFGGSNTIVRAMSETTLLLLELTEGSLQVTKVVKPDELGMPSDRLKEEIRKLELSSQERIASSIEQDPRKEQQRRSETEREVQLLEQKVTDSEQLIQDLNQQVEKVEERAIKAEGTSRWWEQKGREMEGRWREAEQRANEAMERLQQVEVRLRGEEERSQELERQIREMQTRWREAEGTTNTPRQQLELTQDTSWMVERSEIHLTERELGRGGWATVHVAEFRGLQVAAKSLHNIIISEYNFQLFVREMSIAAKLRHPNLTQFIGAALERQPVILTELMATSLRSILERMPLSAANVISISCDVARALNYLHLTKPEPILHRDVSSANVLLNAGPNHTWLAKLSDFGSANFVRQVMMAGPGNPAYAAPEASHPSLQSPKMDIYSYGVLMLEMATRRFPDKSALALQMQHIKISKLPSIIQQCIQDDLSRRPHIGDLLARLCEIHT